MNIHTKSIIDKTLSKSIFLTSVHNCPSLRDKLAGVVRGRRIFIIPFSMKNGDSKTTLGKAYVSSQWHLIELNESIECNFDDFDGKMLKVRTDNARQLMFALSELKDLFVEKAKKGPML